jgi:hypothetical protein
MTITAPHEAGEDESAMEIANRFAGIIRDSRAYADRLCAEDGSPDARRRAKSIRISASHDDRILRRCLDLCGITEAFDAQRVSAVTA